MAEDRRAAADIGPVAVHQTFGCDQLVGMDYLGDWEGIKREGVTERGRGRLSRRTRG